MADAGGTCRHCGKVVKRDDSDDCYRDYEDVSPFCDPELKTQAHALVNLETETSPARNAHT